MRRFLSPPSLLRLARRLVLIVVAVGSILLFAQASTIVAVFWEVPYPAAWIVGAYGGGLGALVLVFGMYALGRYDGYAAGFHEGAAHRDRQAAFRERMAAEKTDAAHAQLADVLQQVGQVVAEIRDVAGVAVTVDELAGGLRPAVPGGSRLQPDAAVVAERAPQAAPVG